MRSSLGHQRLSAAWGAVQEEPNGVVKAHGLEDVRPGVEVGSRGRGYQGDVAGLVIVASDQASNRPYQT